MTVIQRSKEKRNEINKETEEKYKKGEERQSEPLTIEEIMFVHTLHSFVIMCHTFLQKD